MLVPGVLVKLASVALAVVAFMGIWFTVYEDDNFRVDARLVKYNIGAEQATIELRITSKLPDDVFVESIWYQAFADADRTVLLAYGAESNINLPAGETITKTMVVDLENTQFIGSSVYIQGKVDYIRNGQPDTVRIDEVVAIPGL